MRKARNVFYVVDDHPMMRDAIALMLRRLQPAAGIVEIDRLDKLAGAVERNGAADLICLDLNLPDTKGCAGVQTARREHPEVPIAVYSALPAADMEALCLSAGANIYIEKASDAAGLIKGLRSVLKTGDDKDEAPTAAPEAGARLTPRQVQLVQLIAEGLGNREMAERLEISEDTVKVHMWRLYRRIGVNSRTQALHYARTNGHLSGAGAAVAA
ncbi:LuxR C-terminal-related transcriptional regulator [Variovorax saccharolyticus]|uniref:LuxR C-terminal-related transcriptional regulator n=1 Tax=Variovorax saccharolyticus TaxID=3053516 RepID=UPI0025760F2E|nr:response regulator transcription factor [Variovorax sp. J22R187]MDM0021643.1 response regulator transcription factor [Variovorax sp. J22R187]